MKKQILITIAAAVLLELGAEVYLLGPGRSRASGTDTLAGLLPGMEKVLFKERITVNSYGVDLEVSAVRGNIEDIILILKRMKAEKLSVSGGTVRFERKIPGRQGMVERFLLIAARENRPITCFRMEVPEKLPPPGEWPSELPPLPPGAQITAITRLGQGGICGEFRNAQEPPYVLLRRVDSMLRNRKMYAAGNEIASKNGGRGELFFDSRSIIWVNFSSSGQGVFFYRRRK